MTTREDLWQQLSSAGLVSGELPPPATHSVWYIRAMLGVAGWIGAWFLMGFFGLAFTLGLKNASAMFILGALCCAGAFAIFRSGRNNDFLTQFGLVVSLAGQFMIGFSIASLFDNRETSLEFLLFAVFEVLLVAIIPNFVHRVLSTIGAVGGIAVALALQGAMSLLPSILAFAVVMIWLNEFRWAAHGSMVRPIGYGVTLILLSPLQLVASIWSHHELHNGLIIWLGPLIIGAMLIKLVFGLLVRYEIAPNSKVGAISLAAAVAIAATAFKAPGIGLALLVVILGFANANRILIGIGIIALLMYISHFYYQLNVTLLVKSMVLVGTGCALIAVRYGLHVLFPTEQRETPHA